jgi:hypothetical protein
VKKDQPEYADRNAVQRVLEMVRGEDGKFYLLLEYLGYRYLEVRLESRLVDTDSEELRTQAGRPTENTRTHDLASACSTASARGPSLMPYGIASR